MIVVTTPMCKKIVEIAGLDKFKVNKYPDDEEGDLAILLSESKVKMPSIAIKLNTFSQIKESILKLTDYFYENKLIETKISEEDILTIFKEYCLNDSFFKEYFCNSEYDGVSKGILLNQEFKKRNKYKKVKVYSEFLKDIVKDMGCDIVEDNSFNYVIFPDYLKSQVIEFNKINKENLIFIEIPTHSNVSKDPLVRVVDRYSFLFKNLKRE